MLIPKRVKYRRQHRPNRSGLSKGCLLYTSDAADD